jgi:hypothetical protein
MAFEKSRIDIDAVIQAKYTIGSRFLSAGGIHPGPQIDQVARLLLAGVAVVRLAVPWNQAHRPENIL